MKEKLLTAIAGMVVLMSCTRQQEWRTAEGVTWGTTYHITYSSGEDLSDSIVAVMREVDLAVSPFNAESTISRVNRGETDTVTAMFAELFNESRRISGLSGGMFDPTVMPLVNLWGFGYKKGCGDERPDSTVVSATLASVGIGECEVTPELVLKRKSAATEFDFSAIAKGYGVDCVARMLERNGCNDYMVEIGGEVSVSGKNSRGEAWHVMIDDPQASPDTHQGLAMVEMSEGAMATSGNYRNFRALADGTRVAHTISPLTGYPVETTTLSVSVIAPECMTADALATACMAMPFEQARAMIESQEGVSALFLIADGTEVRAHTAGPHEFGLPEGER